MTQDLVIWAVAVLVRALSRAGPERGDGALRRRGLLGIALWIGPQVFPGLVATNIFFTASTYSLSIIPLYLLMAQLLLRGGVVVDLFEVGLPMCRGDGAFRSASRPSCPVALLGAVSGSGAATSAALATLAAPQLEQFGYTRRMSVSLAAVAGSLSAVIPPSLVMIIYGSLTAVSIGQLFVGSVIPGAALHRRVCGLPVDAFGEVGSGDGAGGPPTWRRGVTAAGARQPDRLSSSSWC